MYSIFHALDPNERLPRELLHEGRRYRHFERPSGYWLAVALYALYLPILLLIVVVLVSLNVNALLAFSVAGVALAGVYVVILATRRPRSRITDACQKQ